MLKKIREFIDELKGVLHAALGVLNFIKRHKVFCGSLAVLAIGCGAAYYFAFIHPGRVISSFYKDLDSQQVTNAWFRMDQAFRDRRWKQGVDEFSRDYESTLAHQINEVSNVNADIWKTFQGLFANTHVYKIEIIAEDRFTGEILKHPWQAFNERCLRLRHPNADVEALLKGSPTADGGESISLKRRFLLDVTVKRNSLSWTIAGFRWREVGILWRAQ